MSVSRYPELLVSTAWLAEHIADPNVRIVDIRGHVLPPTEPPPHYFNHEADYVHSHIPGAVFIDWVKEITDPADPRHAQIAKPKRYAAVMSRIGITPETFVVAYDDANGMMAARLWWSLNYYGHDRVAVLDGGWNKWLSENRPVTAEIPQVAPAQFIARPDPLLRRTADDVLAKLYQNSTKLLDFRSKDEFDGKASRTQRFGHIPGAVSSPRSNFTYPDGTMLPAEELRQKFTEVGVNEQTPEVITYCNGGVSASFGLLALRAAGFDNAALYDGSWKDWSSDVDKPIE